MKKLILISLVIFFVICSRSWAEDKYIESSDLVKRDNLYYEKFTDVPYSGNVKGKKKGKLVNGIIDGEWKVYYDKYSTRLEMKVFYVNGIREGETLLFHPNGQLAGRMNRKNDLAHGEMVIYYENGELSSKGNYINGEEDGEYIKHHDNGKLNIKAFYINGKLDGEYMEYHEDGKLNIKAFYINGKLDGEHFMYGDNGLLIEKRIYKNDEVLEIMKE